MPNIIWCKICRRSEMICKITFGNFCSAGCSAWISIPPATCIFKYYAGKWATTGECTTFNTRHTVWDRYACKRATIIERSKINTNYTVRNFYACKRGAAGKCVHTDIRYTFWQYYWRYHNWICFWYAFCDLICWGFGVKIKALKPYRFSAFVLYAILEFGTSVSVGGYEQYDALVELCF